ncbi:hypothetical protein GGU10DRAFT_366468 [Lentinula aff. detonsa]|uniref:Uncharacterized protein n=1 Tax=Lentinula aff. detonsa TaxID=2804958 RepID=A0AA38NHQ4_9AGAR|nr:hypothetical protein GGU10DRAFT_366468 [Lentinula aff. detonsa]
MPLPESTLTRRGPNTNVTCGTEFQWTEDTAQLSPCLVAAAVVGGCGSSDYTVPSLTAGIHYNPPGVNGQPINGCSWWAPFFLFSGHSLIAIVSSTSLYLSNR